jgi:hypothetical protein
VGTLLEHLNNALGVADTVYTYIGISIVQMAYLWVISISCGIGKQKLKGHGQEVTFYEYYINLTAFISQHLI